MNALSTASGSSSSQQIPVAWVQRLFQRMGGLYGKHWLEMWADVPLADALDAWQDALAGLRGEQIKAGLEHVQRHNKYPPTAPEFAAICRQYRAEKAHLVALPAPRTDMPPHIRAKLRAFVAKAKA